MTSPYKPLRQFHPNFTEMFLWKSTLNFFQRIAMATKEKNLKYLLLENRKSWSLNIWHETSSSQCLPSCSNKSPGVKIGQALGVIDFPYLYIVKT
jgi:hypothetical protein